MVYICFSATYCISQFTVMLAYYILLTKCTSTPPPHLSFSCLLSFLLHTFHTCLVPQLSPLSFYCTLIPQSTSAPLTDPFHWYLFSSTHHPHHPSDSPCLPYVPLFLPSSPAHTLKEQHIHSRSSSSSSYPLLLLQPEPGIMMMTAFFPFCGNLCYR